MPNSEKAHKQYSPEATMVALELCATLPPFIDYKTGRVLTTDLARRAIDAAKWRARTALEQPYFGEPQTEKVIGEGEQYTHELVPQLVEAQVYKDRMEQGYGR